MRIHSNLITHTHIYQAADYAGLRGLYGHVFVEGLEQRGSRTRAWSWNFVLRGDGTVFKRRPNLGTSKNRDLDGEYAATWCQWGDFLASLYAVDPNMHCTYYADADDFHRQTANIFTGSGMGSCEMQRCTACRGTIPLGLRVGPVPRPTRSIPEEVTAERAAQRAAQREADRQRFLAVRRRPAPVTFGPITTPAEPTQRDIVAEIERTIDAYEREHGPGSQAERTTPYGTQLGHLDDDPCGYRFC